MDTNKYNPYSPDNDFCKLVTEEVHSVTPPNPITGLCDSVLSRFETTVSDAERAKLSKYITDNPSVDGLSISDDDLLSILPSRRISSLSEVGSLRAYYQDMYNKIVKDNN